MPLGRYTKLGVGILSIASACRLLPLARSRNLFSKTQLLKPTFNYFSLNCFSSIASLSARKSTAMSAADLEALDQQLEVQKEAVRKLKANKAPKDQVEAAVALLKDLKTRVEALEVTTKKAKFDRGAFEEVMRRRFFFNQGFEIYNGVAGLYDYGPPGCALKNHWCALWRDHFAIEDGLLEIDCTCVTPEPVLKASGHVDKFTDLMVKDTVNGDCFRADKLLGEVIEGMLEDRKLPAEQRAHLEKLSRTVDAMSAAEIAQHMKALNVVAPETKNPLTDPYPYNLMFATQIGPRGDNPAYLRPETAQGIFINFKRLLDFNNGRLPFGVAQIGRAFRNEIAPRSGLLRVREFEMAEIEYFVNTRDKSHPKFASVAQLSLPLFDREHQLGDGKVIATPLGEAVASGIIANETLAYFLARTYLFLVKIGLKADRIRFRQHLATEMAHYACDCWDAECQSSYGWVECVGHADRACFDLSHHSESSGVELTAYEKFDKPQQQDIVEVVLDKKALGQQFKKDAKLVTDALEALAKNVDAALAWSAAAAAGGCAQLALADGRSVEVQAAHARFEKKTKEISGAAFFPGVIEPSFGIGRVIYSLLEHSYWVREGDDEKRAVLSLPALIAPYKCAVLPLMNQDKFSPFTSRLRDLLRRSGLSCRVDDSGVSIGRRYARMDEVGVPFAITIDHTTIDDDTVTLRERDSTSQVRMPIAQLSSVLLRLCDCSLTWSEVASTFPAVAVVAE